MVCSPARLAANRKNAQNSTGPEDPRGQGTLPRQRPEARPLLLRRRARVAGGHRGAPRPTGSTRSKPQNDYPGLARRTRLHRQPPHRARRAHGAALSRPPIARRRAVLGRRLRLAAERLGGKIGQRPAEIVEELRRTPCGCDWLISRWSMLAHAADIDAGQPGPPSSRPWPFAPAGHAGRVPPGRAGPATSSTSRATSSSRPTASPRWPVARSSPCRPAATRSRRWTRSTAR